MAFIRVNGHLTPSSAPGKRVAPAQAKRERAECLYTPIDETGNDVYAFDLSAEEWRALGERNRDRSKGMLRPVRRGSLMSWRKKANAKVAIEIQGRSRQMKKRWDGRSDTGNLECVVLGCFETRVFQ